MSEATNRSPERPDRMSLGKWLRHMHRSFMAGITVAVWVLAIAGAWHLHQRAATTGTITGFADDQPIRIAHREPGVVRVVHVSLYEAVAGGQILVSMDDRQERIQLAAVEDDVERLRAEIAAAEARLSADNARAQADVDDLERRFAIDRERAHIDYLSKLAVDARNRIELRGKLWPAASPELAEWNCLAEDRSAQRLRSGGAGIGLHSTGAQVADFSVHVLSDW